MSFSQKTLFKSEVSSKLKQDMRDHLKTEISITEEIDGLKKKISDTSGLRESEKIMID